MSDSYKIYASKDYVDSKSLPDGQGANQQLVTDANGVAKWEDRLAYTNTLLSVQSPDGVYAWYKVSDEPLTGIEDVDMGAIISVWLNGEQRQVGIGLKQDDFIAVSELLVVAVLRDDCTIELGGVKFGHFPKRGMYFFANVDVAVTGVAIDSYATEPDISWDKNTETIKTIDPKYLPSVGGGGFMRIDISANEDESEFYANVSGVAITEALNNGIMPYCVIAGMVCPLMQSPALSPASVMAAAPMHTFSSIQIKGTGNSFVLKCEIDIAEPDVPCRAYIDQYLIASGVLEKA